MKKKYLFIPVLVLVSVFVSLVAFEVGLQILHRPNKTVGWTGAPARPDEANDLSHRGQEIKYTDEDKVVVLLGDSQVHAERSAYGWMPEKRLQTHLQNSSKKKVKVFSVAGSGWGTDQELLGLKDYYAKYRADSVVLWFTTGNDIWNNLFPTSDPGGTKEKPTYWLENGELKGPNREWQSVYAPYGIRTAVFLDRFGWLENPDIAWTKNKLPPAYEPLAHYEGKTTNDWEERKKMEPLFPIWERVDTEKAHLAIELTPRSPRMQYGVDLTHKLLLEIQKTVEAKGGTFHIFAINKLGEIPSAVEAEKAGEEVHLYQGKYYRTSKKQIRATLNDIFQGLHFSIIDVETPEPEVGPSDKHLNEHANDEVMEKVAQWLSQTS